jgi:hypothetical protein
MGRLSVVCDDRIYATLPTFVQNYPAIPSTSCLKLDFQEAEKGIGVVTVIGPPTRAQNSCR